LGLGSVIRHRKEGLP